MEKPGWKTSEFWLAIAAQVVGILILSGAFSCPADGDCPAWVGMVEKLLGVATMIFGGLGYQVPRALGKAKVEFAKALPAGPPKPPQP